MPSIRFDTWQLCAGIAAAASLVVLYRADCQRRRKAEVFEITKSPLTTVLPGLSQSQIKQLAYPPDLLEGARDVTTPFGSTRVYEIGPVDGQKVLMVHGISTPCLSMVCMARSLVERGCRVMLYGVCYTKNVGDRRLRLAHHRVADLYGRGYSDNPLGHEHSEHLYTSQILAVLASSPISWSAETGFHLIGYSLGGGITAAFTKSFPSLITSLVLIAPSGLLRRRHIGWQSKLLYHTEGLLPEKLVRILVRRRLNNSKAQIENGNKDFNLEDAVLAELGDPSKREDVNSKIDAAVQWQLDNHPGFLGAFISAIRYAPITDQHEMFRTIGRNAAKADSKMIHRKVVLVLGASDPIILKDEVGPDIKGAIGEHRVHSIVLDAGHDVAITKGKQVVEELFKFWTSR